MKTTRNLSLIGAAYLIVVGLFFLTFSFMGHNIAPNFLMGMLFVVPPIAISGPMAVYYSVKILRLNRRIKRKEKNG